MFDGEILAGDYRRFKRFVVETFSTLPNVITINSPGGNLTEATLIGKDAREAFIRVSALFCASSCVFVLIAGTKRSAAELPGSIQLHRPYFDPEYFGSLPATEAAELYKQVLRHSRQYLIDMGMPTDIVDQMFTKGSDEVITMDGAAFINRVGATDPAHYEIFAASCRKPTRKERDDWDVISVAENFVAMNPSTPGFEDVERELQSEYRQTLSRFCEGYRDYLRELRRQEIYCEQQKFQQSRDQIYARYRKEIAVDSK